MPNSKRLSMLMDDLHRNNDLNGAIDLYNEWQASNCYYPEYRQVYDAHSQTYRKVLVPCGTCYHCMESKVNEWVTRMYAHAEDFSYVYFITLTYRSFVSLEAPATRLVMTKLKDAVWHRDSFNSTHHDSYNPSLLIKKHYQDFMKRLRKNTGNNDITNVYCGEYGSKYGRPHFHSVLFSSRPISKSDIQKAWSVALWRSNDNQWSFKRNQRKNGQSFLFPFGRIDFNDLVSNGTFNTTAKVKVDDLYMSPANCFSYVCKYICKRDKANYKRVGIAYNSLYHKQKFVRVHNSEISANIAANYLRECGIDYTAESLYNFKQKHSYEKIVYSPDERVLSEGLEPIRHSTLFGHETTVEFYPSVFHEFKSAFAPFVEFSRGTPIGSVYATNHLQEFKNGVFNKPLLQEQSFVVPSYFRTKARNSVYGLRRLSKSLKGESFTFGALSDFHRLLQSFNATDSKLPFVVPDYYLSEDLSQMLHDPRFTFKDLNTGERILVYDDYAYHYKYDKHKRLYYLSRDIKTADWIRFWCDRLAKEYVLHEDDVHRSKESARLRDRAMCLATDLGADVPDYGYHSDAIRNIIAQNFDSLIGAASPDAKVKPDNLRDAFVKKQNEYLHLKQFDYDNTHKSVE